MAGEVEAENHGSPFMRDPGIYQYLDIKDAKELAETTITDAELKAMVEGIKEAQKIGNDFIRRLNPSGIFDEAKGDGNRFVEVDSSKSAWKKLIGNSPLLAIATEKTGFSTIYTAVKDLIGAATADRYVKLTDDYYDDLNKDWAHFRVWRDNMYPLGGKKPSATKTAPEKEKEANGDGKSKTTVDDGKYPLTDEMKKVFESFGWKVDSEKTTKETTKERVLTKSDMLRQYGILGVNDLEELFAVYERSKSIERYVDLVDKFATNVKSNLAKKWLYTADAMLKATSDEQRADLFRLYNEGVKKDNALLRTVMAPYAGTKLQQRLLDSADQYLRMNNVEEFYQSMAAVHEMEIKGTHVKSSAEPKAKNIGISGNSYMSPYTSGAFGIPVPKYCN